MALEGAGPPPRPPHDQPSHPLPASLRWGLGWTVLVASLGAASGCATGASVEAPAEYDVTTTVATTVAPTSDDASCVIDVIEAGGSPDAIERRIHACDAVPRFDLRAR